jgi:hypothetical protein
MRKSNDKSAWVAPSAQKNLPFRKSLVEVQLEQSGRHASLRRQRLDEDTTERKMIDPTLAPRVKEAHKFACLSVDRTQIATLP